MTEWATLPLAHALAACAVFHTFDREVLRAVLGIDDEAIQQLLRCDAVESMLPMTNNFRLQPADLPLLLNELRRRSPQSEQALHRRAFHHYVERLREPAPQQYDLVEAACMHHLCRLRDLNLDYMQWDEVASMIAAVRAAAPHLKQHYVDQLTIFDADDATRRQDYERAKQMLGKLLERSDIAPGLRAKALIACGFLEMSRADFEHALDSFEQARQVAVEARDHAAQAGTLINQSWIYNELLQFKKALRLSKAGLNHYQKAQDLYGAAYALYSIGNNGPLPRMLGAGAAPPGSG